MYYPAYYLDRRDLPKDNTILTAYDDRCVGVYDEEWASPDCFYWMRLVIWSVLGLERSQARSSSSLVMGTTVDEVNI